MIVQLYYSMGVTIFQVMSVDYLLLVGKFCLFVKKADVTKVIKGLKYLSCVA